MVQLEAHPSPEIVLLSSHLPVVFSIPLRSPSPQIGEQEEGFPEQFHPFFLKDF